MKTVGIFDSGLGGKQFEAALLHAHPSLRTIVVHDTKNMPYGNKTAEEIIQLTEAAIGPLLSCDVVVLACNTATAYAIDYLRSTYPTTEFVGFEPALKMAAKYTKTRHIAVLATPATLRSPRYQKLKSIYKEQIVIYEPNVATLADEIERNNVDTEKLHAILQQLEEHRVDCIILGCTHYHSIEDLLRKLTGNKIHVITPTQAVIQRISSILNL